jgi:carboxyl-terminal processing protease
MNDPQIQRRKRLFRILILLVAFALGVQVERHGWLSHGGEPAEVRQLFRPFWEAWYLIHTGYADPSSVNDERLMQWSIRGMLASLGDTGHTDYLTRDQVKEQNERLKGKLEGIGAIIVPKQGMPTVVQTLPNSPARQAGLRPGDVILEVDGQDVHDLSLSLMIQRIKGPAGSKVQLKVLRGDPPHAVELDIERAEIHVPDVAWQMLPDAPLAHISILNFGQNADEQLREALAQMRQEGAKGLILDVRGNPGGLKEQAVEVTSEFLKPGQTVFIEKDAHGKMTPVPVKPEPGVAQEIPLCLLINQGTASSAEILAGALQDYERGKLIGERTFGTGTVLGQYNLSDGSALLLAIVQWLTPKEREIWHKGITPDITVKMPANVPILLPESGTKLSAKALADSKDTQLQKAIEVLKKELP